MKENQSHFPQRLFAEELTKHYEKCGTKRPPFKKHYTRIIPKNTKSVPVLEKKKQRQILLKKNASAIKRNSTQSFTKADTAATSLQGKILHVEDSLKKAEITLSAEQITKLIPYNRLVRGYKRDLYQYCQIVYGDKKALQEKIQKIEQNPVVGTDLSWQVALNPDSFSKLAGTNICGIKNEQRRQAEESVTHLCDAIDCFTEVVKYARECLQRFPKMELKRYETLMSHKKMAKILQDSRHIEKEKTRLSYEEIIKEVQRNPEVQRYQAQICYWSQVVFGKNDVLQKQMRNLLENPSGGDTLIQQLAVEPESFSKLAGTNVCGIKNKARIHAEAGLSPMLDAIDALADVAEQAKENIIQNQSAQQKCRNLSAKLAQNLYKQRNVSKSSQCLSATPHREVPETSRQAQEREVSMRLNKASGAKTRALVS